LAAAGLLSHEDDHSSAIIDFALALMSEVQDEAIQKKHKINMRIGINTGPVVAGVIGRSKFLYDLWGDTVNTASRMESHGMPGKIQISEATYKNLGKRRQNYILEERGSIKVKGKKDKMRTYFVLGKKPASECIVIEDETATMSTKTN
jgi:class 3 adenylate cyclase